MYLMARGLSSLNGYIEARLSDSFVGEELRVEIERWRCDSFPRFSATQPVGVVIKFIRLYDLIFSIFHLYDVVYTSVSPQIYDKYTHPHIAPT